VSMTPGKSKTIEYTTWNGKNYTASLQDVSTRVTFGIGGVGVKTTIDPDFHHVGPNDTHDDKWIQYIAWNGENWASQCHSHTDPIDGGVSFSFEHFRFGATDSDHEDGTITFIAWDGSHWLLSAPPIGSIPDGGSTPVYFNLEKH